MHISRTKKCRNTQTFLSPNGQRHTHCSFLLSIAKAWISKDEEDMRTPPRRRRQRVETSAENETETPATHQNKRHCTPQTNTPTVQTPCKAPRMNDHSLCPSTGSLRNRLHHFGCFHCPTAPTSKSPSCALHRCLMGRETRKCSQTRGKIVTCSKCEVNLCIRCFEIFHTVQDIVSSKSELQSRLQQ